MAEQTRENSQRSESSTHHDTSEGPKPKSGNSVYNVQDHEYTDEQSMTMCRNEDIDMGGMDAGSGNCKTLLPEPQGEQNQDYHKDENSYKSKEGSGSKETIDQNVNTTPRSQYSAPEQIYKNRDRQYSPSNTSRVQHKAGSVQTDSIPHTKIDCAGAQPSSVPGKVLRQAIPPFEGSLTEAREKCECGLNFSHVKIGGGSASGPLQDKAKTKIQDLEAELQTTQKRADEERSQKDDALYEVAILTQKIQSLQSSQREQNKDVRLAQELMLKKAKVQGGLGDDDKTIRHNFKKLQTDIRDWGKGWANDDIRDLNIQSPEDMSSVINYLAKVIRIDDDKLPRGLTSSDLMATKAPAMCLSALLYDNIREEILERPFRQFQFKLNTSDPLNPEATPVYEDDISLDRIYRELTCRDEKKAQTWRCQTLEILDPSVGDSEAVVLARDNATQQRTKLAGELTEKFLKSPAEVLFRPLLAGNELPTRAQELRAIFQQGLDISARVWKQSTILRCQRLEDLTDKPFTADSEFMDAHPLHQLGLDHDEDETRLDHHRIMMVVSPAILGMGDSDGENYWCHRVWAKAVVWLQE